MKTEPFVRVVAGTFVIISAALTYFFSEWWLLLTCFIGLNLIQSAFTGFCPPSIIARKFGWTKDSCACEKKDK